MKNILIPTDFSIKSLKLAGAAVRRYESERLNIILVHALEADNSISALLSLNKKAQMNALYSDEFMEACEIVRNKYQSSINNIKVEFYQGSTNAYLRNFLDARSIDAIMIAKDYEPSMPSSSSYDMRSILEKTKYTIHYENIAVRKTRELVNEPSLSELLHA